MGRQIIEGIAPQDVDEQDFTGYQNTITSYERFQNRVGTGQSAGGYETPTSPNIAAEHGAQEYREYAQPRYTQSQRGVHKKSKNGRTIGATIGLAAGGIFGRVLGGVMYSMYVSYKYYRPSETPAISYVPMGAMYCFCYFALPILAAISGAYAVLDFIKKVESEGP